MLVLDHRLAIEHRGLAGQLATGIDNPPISGRPIIAVSGEGADLAAINNDEGAIAVVLDLMNPPIPDRWTALAARRLPVMAASLITGISVSESSNKEGAKP